MRSAQRTASLFFPIVAELEDYKLTTTFGNWEFVSEDDQIVVLSFWIVETEELVIFEFFSTLEDRMPLLFDVLD